MDNDITTTTAAAVTPDEENAGKTPEEVLAEKQMAQEADISVSIGALVYSCFMKSGIAKECTPEQWKNFEAEAVRRIYLCMGLPDDEIDPRVCSITALVMGYMESLRLLSNSTVANHTLEKEIERLKSGEAKAENKKND